MLFLDMIIFMTEGVALCLVVDKHSLVASYIADTLRITLETTSAMYASLPLAGYNLTPTLSTIFESAYGLYRWLGNVGNNSNKVSFNNDILSLKISIDGRSR